MNKLKKNELIKKIIIAIKNSINVDVANLHEPSINEDDISSVVQTMQSGFVSSIGDSIKKFEKNLSNYTKSNYAIALCNGTSALHISLLINDIKENDEVLVPALTFVATANAISYCKAIPHFIDSEERTLGINVKKLKVYLENHTLVKNGECINLKTGRRISALIPVHIFGFIGEMEELKKLANEFKIILIEDASEALGSFKNSKHAGTFGICGCLSFNGNKIITTGGGGAILTNDPKLAEHAKHLSTTAKLNHQYEFIHNEIGYNYRMPALNAALGNSQLKKLPKYLFAKKNIRNAYYKNFKNIEGIKFFHGPKDSNFNHWLNSIILDDNNIKYKDCIIKELNKHGYFCRPIWRLLNSLEPYKKNPSMNLNNSIKLQSSIINIPSSPKLGLQIG